MSVDKVREWAELVKLFKDFPNPQIIAELQMEIMFGKRFHPVVYAYCLAYSGYLRGMIDSICATEGYSTAQAGIKEFCEWPIEVWNSVMKGDPK